MNTWTKENPSDLPAPRLTGKLVGGVRLVLLLLLTLVSVVLFLIGRFLRGTLGRWVVFHFGVARFWARACLWLTGIRLRVTGAPVRSGALVANHSSWIDILALRATTLMYFVSKAEVANWPGVGFITRITGTVFIERKRTEAKRQEAVLRSRIAQKQLLCLFPEGTSTDGLRVLPFKSSLFSAFFVDGESTDIMIQPVTLRYHPPKTGELPLDVYGWWGTMGFEKHIWDVLTLSFGGVVDVIFHQAVPASAFEDRKALAEASQSAVARGFEALTHIRLLDDQREPIRTGDTV
ncbi:MAG: lysophospholipid acyltransferase family protein [Pseudomonadota bacterium]